MRAALTWKEIAVSKYEMVTDRMVLFQKVFLRMFLRIGSTLAFIF